MRTGRRDSDWGAELGASWAVPGQLETPGGAWQSERRRLRRGDADWGADRSRTMGAERRDGTFAAARAMRSGWETHAPGGRPTYSGRSGVSGGGGAGVPILRSVPASSRWRLSVWNSHTSSVPPAAYR